MDQMYESDWFLEETIMAWEDTQDHQKTRALCQAFFEAAYIARKRYNKAKRQTHGSLNKITENELQLYLDAIKMKAMQETKERDKEIQQVTEQNTKLMTLVQDQQKKIEELIKQNKELMEAVTKRN